MPWSVETTTPVAAHRRPKVELGSICENEAGVTIWANSRWVMAEKGTRAGKLTPGVGMAEADSKIMSWSMEKVGVKKSKMTDLR